MAALCSTNGGWKAPHLPAAVQLLFITRPGIEIQGNTDSVCSIPYINIYLRGNSPPREIREPPPKRSLR